MQRRDLLKGAAAIPVSLAMPAGIASADTATRGTLTIWLGYPETAEAYRLAMAEFRRTYPNVQVELLTFELREFEAKLAISVPTGSGPDILALHDFLFPRYHESGALDTVPADLAQVVNDPRVIDTPFKNVVTRDGRPWGVPWWSGRNALFCNLDHLREAGLSGPPTSYDEIWTHAQKLAKRNANGDLTRAGISLRKTGPSGVTQKFVYFYYQLAGVQMLEQGGRPGTVRSTIREKIDAAGRVLLDHVEHLHGPKKSDDWALRADAQGFASGDQSMFMRESWVIPFVKKNGPTINFSVTPIPRGAAWGAFNLIQVLSVNKESRLKNAAWDFIRVMQGQPILNNVLESSGWIPLRKDRDYSAILAQEPRYGSMINTPPGQTQYLEAPNTAYEEVTTRMGEVIQTAFRDASIVGNMDAAKRTMMRVHDVAVRVLRDQGIFAE